MIKNITFFHFGSRHEVYIIDIVYNQGVDTMGKYHNKEIPILKVINMEETQKPDNELVNPPENSYIPTSGIF